MFQHGTCKVSLFNILLKFSPFSKKTKFCVIFDEGQGNRCEPALGKTDFGFQMDSTHNA